MAVISKKRLVILTFILLIIASCSKEGTIIEMEDYTPYNYQKPESNGFLYVAIADESVEIEGITSFVMELEELNILEEKNPVKTGIDAVDLLKLNEEGDKKLLSQAELKPGKYKGVKLKIRTAVATIKNKKEPAFIPNNEIIIEKPFEIKPNKITLLVLDFLLSDSLHRTITDKIVFSPVIRVSLVSDALITLGSDRTVILEDKEKEENIKLGMDTQGNMGVGLAIWKDSELIIENDNVRILSKPLENEIYALPNAVKPDKVFEVKMYRSRLNPEKFLVKKGESVQFNTVSLDQVYGLEIQDHDLRSIITPNKSVPIYFTAQKKGIFDIYCAYPCKKEGQSIGKIVVVG